MKPCGLLTRGCALDQRSSFILSTKRNMTCVSEGVNDIAVTQ